MYLTEDLLNSFMVGKKMRSNKTKQIKKNNDRKESPLVKTIIVINGNTFNHFSTFEYDVK